MLSPFSDTPPRHFPSEHISCPARQSRAHCAPGTIQTEGWPLLASYYTQPPRCQAGAKPKQERTYPRCSPCGLTSGSQPSPLGKAPTSLEFGAGCGLGGPCSLRAPSPPIDQSPYPYIMNPHADLLAHHLPAHIQGQMVPADYVEMEHSRTILSSLQPGGLWLPQMSIRDSHQLSPLVSGVSAW